MREIPLTQGQVAIVDDGDYDLLSQWKWYAAWDDANRYFYAVRTVRTEKGPRAMPMHRLLMGLEYGDKRHVDHVDGITLNNRRANLQIVTNRQNCQNKRMHREGKLVGASFHNGKWVARIWIGRKQIWLGYFPTEQAAHEAYLQAVDNLQETL
jgi:hypothetical protein